MTYIMRKYDRLMRDGGPRVVDLFAGCGGMSLGAKLAGCSIIGSVEIDPDAAATHSANFHDGSPVHSVPRDMRSIDPWKFLAEVGSGPSEVDFVIGGPPCQAFAKIGRAKLREVGEDPQAFLKDGRSRLYENYVSFVRQSDPVAVVIENVPDVLSYGGTNIFEVIADGLDELGYECRYALLNSVHYGVPQTRTRCFLAAIHRSVATAPFQFPAPTRSYDLPVGYANIARSADKGHEHMVQPPVARGIQAVTSWEAIGDGGVIREHLEGKKPPRPSNSARQFGYHSKYATFMTQWPGYASDGLWYDHVIRYLPRDHRIFAEMQPGDQYPQAHAIAEKLRDEAAAKEEARLGRKLDQDEHARLTEEFVPPYPTNTFPNRWRKMDPSEPARTIMAHMGKDSYTHVHYDRSQARTISVREAARLQSFPDGFKFCGSMNSAFRQIGNAVPPLLAYAVVDKLIEHVTGRPSKPESLL